MTADLWRMSATDQAAAIRSGQASSREVIEAHLRRIDAVNPTVNAGGGERRMLEDRAGIITPVDPREPDSSGRRAGPDGAREDQP